MHTFIFITYSKNIIEKFESKNITSIIFSHLLTKTTLSLLSIGLTWRQTNYFFLKLSKSTYRKPKNYLRILFLFYSISCFRDRQKQSSKSLNSELDRHLKGKSSHLRNRFIPSIILQHPLIQHIKTEKWRYRGNWMWTSESVMICMFHCRFREPEGHSLMWMFNSY